MARTKKSSVKPVEKREVSRKVINGKKEENELLYIKKYLTF